MSATNNSTDTSSERSRSVVLGRYVTAAGVPRTLIGAAAPIRSSASSTFR